MSTGPKAYIAQGTKQDNDHSGSTVLHMDLTSAVNVMVWAADMAPGEPGFALWHIFSATSSNCLREFLVSDVGYAGVDDPIHSQTVCMTPSLLDQLFSSRAVRPYTIKQYAGDAVFIPAGCAHQVIWLPDLPPMATYVLSWCRSATPRMRSKSHVILLTWTT